MKYCTAAADIALQDSTFRQLRDFIYENSGIFISDAKKYFIENKLVRRLQEKNLSSFEDYLYLLKYGTNGSELTKLFDIITTNETFFFRESQQLDVFFDFVIPEAVGSGRTKNLKVWSAACSTGEEPYTISMMRMEKKPGLCMDLFASDISEAVLASASKGVYSPYSVRNIPENYLKKYFKANGQAYELGTSVKSTVKFMNINLTNEKKMKLMSGMDIIFCRNVLIYFDDRAKQKAVSLLYDSLRPGGFLFTGTTESLHNVTRAFKPVIVNRVIVYRRA
jgi:chemotaxis protein methyltransferase CheR